MFKDSCISYLLEDQFNGEGEYLFKSDSQNVDISEFLPEYTMFLSSERYKYRFNQIKGFMALIYEILETKNTGLIDQITIPAKNLALLYLSICNEKSFCEVKNAVDDYDNIMAACKRLSSCSVLDVSKTYCSNIEYINLQNIYLLKDINSEQIQKDGFTLHLSQSEADKMKKLNSNTAFMFKREEELIRLTKEQEKFSSILHSVSLTMSSLFLKSNPKDSLGLVSEDNVLIVVVNLLNRIVQILCNLLRTTSFMTNQYYSVDEINMRQSMQGIQSKMAYVDMYLETNLSFLKEKKDYNALNRF